MKTKKKAIYVSLEQKISKALVESNTDFTTNDIRLLAETGALSNEDASQLIQNQTQSAISSKKAHCKHLLHKKAIILIAKEKADPDFETLLKMQAEIHAIYHRLEEKYGMEASVNSGSLLGKIIGDLPESGDIAAKVGIFN